MTRLTIGKDRQQADGPWDWLPAIRQTLLERIHILTSDCEDPRELTDAAELLLVLDKKIQIRLT